MTELLVKGSDSRAAAMGSLTAGLITDLLHYAHRYGLGFDEALGASGTAYTAQRLREEGPFQAGQDTGRDAVLVSSATRPFRPTATRQGAVTSGSNAEWLIVRTAARVRDTERRGHAVSDLTQDIDDKLALSAALAAACSLSISQVLDRLEPRISARAERMQRGGGCRPDGARAWACGSATILPLDADGDDSPLMAAFGETEPTTRANAGYRLAPADAYTDAYKLASATSGPAPWVRADRQADAVVVPPGPGPAGVLPAPPPDDPLPGGQVKGTLRVSFRDRCATPDMPVRSPDRQLSGSGRRLATPRGGSDDYDFCRCRRSAIGTLRA
jgi:hypothetical protein